MWYLNMAKESVILFVAGAVDRVHLIVMSKNAVQLLNNGLIEIHLNSLNNI